MSPDAYADFKYRGFPQSACRLIQLNPFFGLCIYVEEEHRGSSVSLEDFFSTGQK